jgi:hypothetical protein
MVLVLALSLAFARPLVEEWALSNYWHTYGVDHYFALARAWPIRPLQAVPSALAWVIGGRAVVGYAVAFALVLAAKYLAMRWAVGAYLTAQATWLAATMALVLLPWVALWRMRYAAVGLAAALLFVALGALLRNGDRLTIRWTAIGAVATALMLAAYQGPAACSLVLPFVVVAGLSGREGPRPGLVRRWLVAFAPIAGGFVLYAMYSALIVQVVGNAGYEGRVAGANAHPLDPMQYVHDVRWLYGTAYGLVPSTLPMLLGLLLAVLGPVVSAVPVRASQLRWAAGLGAGVVLLPLLGLSYAALPALLLDPDRVSFAVGAGFTLVTVTALLRFAPSDGSPSVPAAPRPLGRLVVPGIVAGLLVWSLLLGNENRRQFEVQDSVATQAAHAVTAAGATTVMLKDWSGRLGDVYSLYPSIAFPAIVAHGANGLTKAVLCTPPGVERYTPTARQLRWPTTERCDKVPPITPEPLRLDVVLLPGGGLKVLAPGEPVPVSP